MVPNVGPIANPRLCIYVSHEGNIMYQWQVFFKSISEGSFDLSEVVAYLQQLDHTSRYVVCPGIQEYPSQLRFKTKHLRDWGTPFCRMDSDSCMLWHIPNNVHHPSGSPLRDACNECKKLHHDINHLVNRANHISDQQLLSRSSVSSNYPLKYLSPTSLNSRVAKITKERKALSTKLSSVSEFDCTLKDKQHEELLELVKAIDKHGSKTIEELCMQGDKVLGESNMLREVWKQDVLERLKFENDQRKSGSYNSAFTLMYT